MLLHDKHVADLEHALDTASVGDLPPAYHWDPETMSAEQPAESVVKSSSRVGGNRLPVENVVSRCVPASA